MLLGTEVGKQTMARAANHVLAWRKGLGSWSDNWRRNARDVLKAK
jgi:hypothetical protein